MKAKFLKNLLALLLLVMPSAIFAADADETPRQALVLKFADETTANFFLADKPTIGFADGKLTMTSEVATTDYDQADVVEFYFDNVVPTAIASSKSKTFSLTYNDNRTVKVSGSKASTATLYAADGALVQSKNVTDGVVTMTLDGCQPGVYVLILENEHTFKLIKK